MSAPHPEDRFNSLDTADANEMFELQARIMKSHDVRSVLDVGCRQARPLEWLDSSITYHGFDIVPDMPDRLREKYPADRYPNTQWLEGDWHQPPFAGKYDCLIFGGMFYYNKDRVIEILDLYIKKYEPKLILICDIDYKTPAHWWAADFTALKEKFYHKEYTVLLPSSFHGMNQRVIFEIDLTIKGNMTNTNLLRKDVTPLDPSYDGYQAPSYPVDEMLEWIYVSNTEPLDNIGKYMHKSFEIDYWIGVAAGFKPYYTLAKFGLKPNTRVIYADVSPREIHWRKYFDDTYRPDMTDSEMLEMYLEYQRENPQCEFIRGDINQVGEILRAERKFLNISDQEWNDVWQQYRNLEKIYLTTNIIDNIDYVLEIVKPKTNAYVWTSNAWDWHQFRYTEADFNEWTGTVKKHFGNEFWYDGKLPPFSSMK
jgi:hypothetical protein